jgi:hypothetical protein
MKKANKKLNKKAFDYFTLEQADGEIVAHGDFADKDFGDWLWMIHNLIQKVFEQKLFDGIKVENYFNFTFYFGGQRVDIAIVKDGRKGPDELYKELLKEQEADYGR